MRTRRRTACRSSRWSTFHWPLISSHGTARITRRGLSAMRPPRSPLAAGERLGPAVPRHVSPVSRGHVHHRLHAPRPGRYRRREAAPTRPSLARSSSRRRWRSTCSTCGLHGGGRRGTSLVGDRFRSRQRRLQRLCRPVRSERAGLDRLRTLDRTRRRGRKPLHLSYPAGPHRRRLLARSCHPLRAADEVRSLRGAGTGPNALTLTRFVGRPEARAPLPLLGAGALLIVALFALAKRRLARFEGATAVCTSWREHRAAVTQRGGQSRGTAERRISTARSEQAIVSIHPISSTFSRSKP